MPLSLTQLSILGSSIAFEGAAVVQLRKNGLRARWPFFFAYVHLDLMMRVLLASMIYALPDYYFYAYWIWAPIQTALQLLLLVDIARSFPGSAMFGIDVPALVGGAAATLAAGTAVLSLSAGTTFRANPLLRAMDIVTLVDRTANIAALTFIVGSLVAVFAARVAWSRRGAWVGNGLFLVLGGSTIASMLTSAFPHSHIPEANILGGIVVVAGMAAWVKAASLEHETFRVPAEAAPLLLRLCPSSPAEKVGL